MKHLKRYLTFLLALVLLSSVSLSSINAKEFNGNDTINVDALQTDVTADRSVAEAFDSEITPFASIGMTAYPTDGDYDVHGANPVQITAYWMQGPVAQEEPVTITISNEGMALDEASYEIEHTTNVGRANESTTIISNATINADLDVMEFTTGVNAKNTLHSISFWVEAPLGKRNFTVKVKIDSGRETLDKNTVIIPFNVISGLTVDVVDDSQTVLGQIDDYNPFFVEGLAWYKGGDAPNPSILSISMFNKTTGEEVVEFLDTVDIVNRNYNHGPLIMPSTYDDGIYVVTVHLVDMSGMFPRLLGEATTEVNFVKLPDIFTKGIYKLSTRLGSYVDTKDDPNRFAEYSFLTVDGSGNPVGGEAVGAKVILKNASNVNLANSRFVVSTGYGNYTFPVTRSGNDISAALNGIRAGVAPQPSVRAFIARTDGSIEEYYVGVINVVVRTDPAGVIIDGETRELISGATCTLRVFDPEQGYVDWVDVTGLQPNPVITTEDGKFQWDVDDGKYEVVVYHPDYHLSEHTAYSTLTDENIGEMVVPPEHLNLEIKLFNQHPVEPEIPEN